MKKAISVLKYAVSLGLAFLLLYLAFRNINLSEFLAKSKEVDYTWVVASIILSVVAYYARAYRWNILLEPLGYKNLNVHRTNIAVVVGYLANLVFPRLGEITRCGMMKRTDDVQLSASFGTVISERIIDFLTLVSMILFALMLEYDVLMKFLTDTFSGLGETQNLIIKTLIFLVIAGVVFLLILYFLYQRVEKIREFLNDLLRGLLSLKDISRPVGFILSTIVLWVTYYYMSYIIVFSVPETAHLTWQVGLMLLVTGGIALVIPLPGGIGSYHVMISAMLVLYGIEKTTGVFLATLLHSSQVVAVAIFGGIGLLVSVFLQKSKDRAAVEE